MCLNPTSEVLIISSSGSQIRSSACHNPSAGPQAADIGRTNKRMSSSFSSSERRRLFVEDIWKSKRSKKKGENSRLIVFESGMGGVKKSSVS